MTPRFLGEFEQMVILVVLRLKDEAFALAILKELDARAGRSVSRGTLYKTLERLEAKGFLEWSAEEGTPERGGHARRRFTVTNRGVSAVQEARQAFQRLWEGMEDGVRETGS